MTLVHKNEKDAEMRQKKREAITIIRTPSEVKFHKTQSKKKNDKRKIQKKKDGGEEKSPSSMFV